MCYITNSFPYYCVFYEPICKEALFGVQRSLVCNVNKASFGCKQGLFAKQRNCGEKRADNALFLDIIY